MGAAGTPASAPRSQRFLLSGLRRSPENGLERHILSPLTSELGSGKESCSVAVTAPPPTPHPPTQPRMGIAAGSPQPALLELRWPCLLSGLLLPVALTTPRTTLVWQLQAGGRCREVLGQGKGGSGLGQGQRDRCREAVSVHRWWPLLPGRALAKLPATWNPVLCLLEVSTGLG